ncbi:hypothetical protein N7541_000244 [Penicillium brevicompactum]|uniref:Uncharacterized protein n=1 Tax=Penicillium brevicompactum TaxID=5074 RepID=A0A9W9RTR6_PENBR|nr:hypothetical protein N7541_000244 [Penicillium brevicompactum]
MQISRYLPKARSSVYMIDHEYTSAPANPTQRNKDLLEMAESAYGFGADIGSPDVNWSLNKVKITTCWLRNQWPRTLLHSREQFSFLVQWAVNDGVVIQQQQFTNLQDEEISVYVSLDLNFLIRNEDSVDNNARFNMDESDDYADATGPGGVGFVKTHSLRSSDEEPHGDAVAVVMGLFVDGKAVEVDPDVCVFSRTIPKNGTLDLVCGYKLIHLSRDDSKWEHLVLKAQDVDIDRLLRDTDTKSAIPNFLFDFLSEKTFHIGRNVEHILSVCMIPINDEATAMTCGDMSGHRVSVSASL